MFWLELCSDSSSRAFDYMGILNPVLRSFWKTWSGSYLAEAARMVSMASEQELVERTVVTGFNRRDLMVAPAYGSWLFFLASSLPRMASFSSSSSLALVSSRATF